jgi:oligopeptide/dipeptide ABC transporter ATP-binding protein
MEQDDNGRLLRVADLCLSLETGRGRIRVLDGVSFEVGKEEIVGLVGESGSGKSVTVQSILRLLPSPPWLRDGGTVFFDGADLYELGGEQMRRLRGKEIAVVLQEPMTSLNPFSTVGRQVEEVLASHLGVTRREARERSLRALAEAGVPAARDRARQYPHQLSGGLKQRAMIAMALVLRPGLLLADEPTTALDPTIQAQILRLLERLNREMGMAVLFITHDLRLIRGLAGRTVVMYAGMVVEDAVTGDLFREPLHPYTRALVDIMPVPGAGGEPLGTIPGSVPKPGKRPAGCPFHPRCRHVMERCREAVPPPTPRAAGGSVRCWLY